MSWTLAGIKNNIKSYINPSGSGFNDGQEAYLTTLINSAISGLAVSFPIPELRHSATIVTKADYDTGTVTVSQGSKSVTGSGTAWDYTHIGMKIRIDGARDFYVIANVTSGTALTLDRAFLPADVTGVEYTIFENTYPLPSDCNWIKGVYNFDNGINPLTIMGWDEIEDIDPALQHTSTIPERYSERGQIQLKEPSSGYLTLDAGSNTLTAISSSLLSTVDDYYKDWLLVNVTREATARVTAYTASTQTLTLDKAITSQTTSDSVYLMSTFNHISIYRRPTTAIGLNVKYYRTQPDLINNYDVPLLPELFLDAITFDVLTTWYLKDENARVYEAMYNTEYDKLVKKFAVQYNKNPKQGRRQPTGRLMTISVQE